LQLEDKNYQLRVEKDGYKTKSLTLNPRNQSEIININLEPDAFTLTINSDSDAKVYINNTFTGYASFSKKLQPGTYKIKCLYDSEQYEKEITLKKDMTLTFNFNSELSEQSFKMKSCVNVICLSERNKFAIADSEGVQIFNARGKVINNLSTDSEIKSMIFSDEDRLLIGSMDGVVSEYNFKTGVLQDLFSLDGWILDIEANAKGYIAASSRNGEVIVYDASTKRQLYKYDGNKFYSILQLEMAENGEVFFSTTEKKLYASDLTNEREIYTGTGIIKSMTLENDTLFTSDTNGCLMACTYDFTKMTVLNKIKKTMDNSNYIYIQRLNNHLITVDETGNLRLFDDELNLIKAFKDNPEIQCMQFIQTDEQPFMLYALTNNVYIKKFSSY